VAVARLRPDDAIGPALMALAREAGRDHCVLAAGSAILFAADRVACDEAALALAGDETELPPDAVAMVSMSNAPVGAAPATADVSLGGRPLPATLTVVLQLTPELSLDLVAEFAQDSGAAFWSARWPELDGAERAALLGWPRPVLPLAAQATLTHDGNKLRLQETVTREALESAPLVAALVPRPGP
jgi:hypothetical protein